MGWFTKKEEEDPDPNSPEAGNAFLQENAKNEGVVVLESGLQYKIITPGTGDTRINGGSPCIVNYTGWLLDGTLFDSTYARGHPLMCAPNQGIIRAWSEAMQLMVEGDKWELVRARMA